MAVSTVPESEQIASPSSDTRGTAPVAPGVPIASTVRVSPDLTGAATGSTPPDSIFVPAGQPAAPTESAAPVEQVKSIIPRGILFVEDTTPAPAGIDAAIWRNAGLVEISRLVTWHQGAHRVDQARIMELVESSRERAKDIASDQSERENARLIAFEAANDLAYEARIAADPSIEPEWVFGGIVNAIKRVHRLTGEEAAAIETAAKAMLALPRIPYRQPVIGNAPVAAQEAPTAAEGGNADTCAVAVETIDERKFLEDYRGLPTHSREALKETLGLMASGRLTVEKAAAALQTIERADADEIEETDAAEEGGAA